MSYDEHVHGSSAATSATFETVKIPDIFISFTAQEPSVNPLHEQAATESILWLAALGGEELGDERLHKYLRHADFARWAAGCVPDARYDGLRTFVDWIHVMFLFDDLFDSGAMRDDQKKAKDLMSSFLAGFKGQKWPSKKHPWVKAHDAIWARIQAGGNMLVAERFRECTEAYCKGVLNQVKANSDNSLYTVDERIERATQESSATKICFCLVEYAYGISIPDHVYRSAEFQRIVNLGSELVVLNNEPVSYLKEQTEGVNNNAISIARARGMSAQAAFNHMGERLKECHKKWYLALAALPIFGEETDKQVQLYIKGIMNCARAFAHGSFISKRYLGNDGPSIRQTRIIRVFSDAHQQIWRRKDSHHGNEVVAELLVRKKGK